jgi:hypothetical protein
MIWVLVCLAPLVAVVARIVTLRRRPEIWWLAFTLTLVGILAGSVLLVNESAVNRILGIPNVSYLLSCLLFLLAAGSVTVYVHTLRHAQPKVRVIAAIAAATAAVWLALILLWMAAPVHDHDADGFRSIPLSPSLVAFEVVFHGAFIPVLINVAVCASTLARQTPPGDPARKIGLVIIAASNSLDVLAHVLYLVRVALQPTIGSHALSIAAAADLVTLIAVFGIGVGTTALLAVPRVLHVLRARQLTRRLRPLWRRTLELYPEVSMRGGWRIRGGATLQAERMLIEIADALRLLPVTESAGRDGDPFPVVAAAFQRPTRAARPAGGRTAADALPKPTSRLEEEEQLLTLAHHYGLDRLT